MFIDLVRVKTSQLPLIFISELRTISLRVFYAQICLFFGFCIDFCGLRTAFVVLHCFFGLKSDFKLQTAFGSSN